MKIALKPLAEQSIVITGASSGIGLTTARIAAQRGAKVLLVARNGPALEEIVGRIKTEGGVAKFAVADVGDLGAVEAAAEKAIEHFGRIDTWVNCAGIAIYAPLLDTPEHEHQRMFQTNYFGTVHGANVAVRHLRDRGGALITVASIASDIPTPILGAYAASKHAVKGFINSLRIELRADGLPISVTIIKPAGISTPIGVHAANHLDGEAMIPPPPYDPALVADAILHCATHRRREITVGGAGRAQVLFGEHFPALLERLAPLMIPSLSSKKIPKIESDALFQPGVGGSERSAHEPGLRHSVYTSAGLHPWMTGLVVGAASLVLGSLALARRRARSLPA